MASPIAFFRLAISTVGLTLSLVVGVAPVRASVPIPGMSFSLEELLFEARESCEDLRGRERRRCLREAEAEARATAERWAVVEPVALAYRRRLVQALANEGTARSLALAAVLGSKGLLQSENGANDIDMLWREDARVSEWRDAALAASAASGRDDPLVLILAFAVSAKDTDLQRTLFTRWRMSEPDNLQPILSQAGWERHHTSQADKDEHSLSAGAFAAAAQASHYHEYFVDLQRLAVQALRRHPPSDAELQAFRAFDPEFDLDGVGLALGLAFWNTGPLAAFSPLLRSCDAERFETVPGRREDCRNIGMRMHDRGDTLIAQLFGIALLRRTAGDEDEREQARALRRQYDWRTAQLAQTKIDASAWAAGQVEFLLQDVDAIEAQLVEAGMRAIHLPTEPPADWVSDYLFPDEREPSDAPPSADVPATP